MAIIGRHLVPVTLSMLIGMLLLPHMLFAQPANDDCSNAQEILISGGGFGYGSFSSDTISLSGAGAELGEAFAAGQPNGKSVWFKFSIPTTRQVRISLDQPGNMPASSAGWTLYKTQTCVPSHAEAVVPFIFNIEGFTHACLRKGEYLVQVCANLNANGDIFLVLEVDPSTAPEVEFDHAAGAHDLQIIGSSTGRTVNYEVGCQSYFLGERICPDSSFTKTTWQVFTTDSYVDNVRIDIRENPFNTQNVNPREYGYVLYEGDARLDSMNLPLVDSCRRLTQTSSNAYQPIYYPCELKPNTTYSLQLLFPTDYFADIEVTVGELGVQATRGPDPDTLPLSHQLGTLALGTSYQVTDYYSCNAYMRNYLCPPVIQDTIRVNNIDYELNWWVTFEISQKSDVALWLTNYAAYAMGRLFQGDIRDSCNLDFVSNLTGSQTTYPCLEPGVYSVQMLGAMQGTGWGASLGERSILNVEMLQQSFNKFGRATATAIDSINGLLPLQAGNTYTSTLNYFDCELTAMPPGDSCHGNYYYYYPYNFNDRAMYRVVQVGQNGVLTVSGGNWLRYRYKVFQGNAGTLPVSNGIITGLQDLTCCQSLNSPVKLCVSPGYYTVVTYGDIHDINISDQISIGFDTFPAPSFVNPAAPEMLDTLFLGGTVNATPTYVTCYDNPDTLLGHAPCLGGTKQFYREFYLGDTASVSFSNYQGGFYYNTGASNRIFQGRISNNSLTGLERDCFSTFTMSSCDFMTPGWYTIVSYNTGDSDTDPGYCGGTGTYLGEQMAFSLTTNPPYPPPNFNTFAKAEQVNGGQALTWAPRAGHSHSIPDLDTTYVLGTEYFNCEDDLPFPAGINPCLPGHNRVSYRVFSLAKPSFVRLGTGYGYPYTLRSRLYQGDVTSLSPPFTIIEDCFTDYSWQCLDSGTYTFVTFVNDAYIGSSLTPDIYIDSLGISKFDHARDAYNFGNIPRDSIQYLASPGAALDALGRPASNDFIFCSTGAEVSDPANNCYIGSTTSATNPRQNLWYTFEATGPGNIDVSVYSLSPNKHSRMPFSVYRVTNNNYPLTDSTVNDLTLEAVSYYNNRCTNHYQTITLFRDPCAGISTDRYVVIVDRYAYSSSTVYLPNIQVQLGLRFYDVPGTSVQYDHFSQANIINANPTIGCNPPFTADTLKLGTFTGCEGNLTCATQDATDQNSCGAKTIWYKFEVEGSGRLRVNYTRTDNNTTGFDPTDLVLFREVIPGDSSSSGLTQIPLASVYENNPDFPGNYYWGQSCYTQGTYYLMFTGCNFPNATVIPRIWIDNFPGDFCQDSLQLTVDTVGTFQVTGTVDCWTIGEGPGEGGLTSMECLGDPIGQKSGWFHITVDDTGKMDLDINLTENTSATSLQVNYRVGNGSCNLMTFENCVDDGVFITLNLKCRRDSGLWIQVVLPDNALGTVSLNVSATQSTDSSCVPLNPFAPKSNFDFQQACVGDVVQFVNQSSIGNGLYYAWDFGDGFTSNLYAPSHVYFTEDTFLVQLIVTDSSNLESDTSQRLIFIYPNPSVSFTPSASQVIGGNPVNFSPAVGNLLPSATYYWQFCSGGGFCSADLLNYYGVTPPPVTYTIPGTYEVCLTVTNALCDSTYCDSIVVTPVNVFGGGAYDGSDSDDSIGCPVINIFSGGPYDGFDKDDTIACPAINFFAGGPYDGFDMDDSADCPAINFYAGGPYDGFDREDSSFCNSLSFFAGGPYDGFDSQGTDAICEDSMVSIFSGANYDGAASASRILDCPTPSPFAGGPFDGAASALLEADCPVVNVFTGGPYDGFDEEDTIACPGINFFAGGPYDGFDSDDSLNCPAISFFAGGPYDGFDDRDTSNCSPINFFTGGPYDGFDEVDSNYCSPVNFFSGGPFDGFDEDNTGDLSTQWASVCIGDSAILGASVATDWYDQASGGNLLASGTKTYVLPNLGQTTTLYAEAVCNDTGRVPVVAHVVDTLPADFSFSNNCATQSSFFVSQMLAPGNSTPTIGTEITGFGTHGSAPGLRELTFSSTSSFNFAYLTNGLTNQLAWSGGNTGPGTVWVQWQYFQPRIVDRITWSDFGGNSQRLPQTARLYYSNGGPWQLVKVFQTDLLKQNTFDSGPFCEATGKEARRWKLELDVGLIGSPQWSEFQVYAHQLVPNANVTWDFGDGTPIQTGSSVSHTFAQPDTFMVTLSANASCACVSSITKPVIIEDCQPLALFTQHLAGALLPDQERIELTWEHEGAYEVGYLEKYLNGHWIELASFGFDEVPFHRYQDPSIRYEYSNLYRMRTHVGEQLQYSNWVELTIDPPEEHLRLYPNPTQEGFAKLEIALFHENEVEIELVNVWGQLLWKHKPGKLKGIQTLTLPTRDLAEGFYFVKVWLGGAPRILRLVVLQGK